MDIGVLVGAAVVTPTAAEPADPQTRDRSGAAVDVDRATWPGFGGW